MEKLKYTVIKTDAQYYKYCDTLEALASLTKKTKDVRDEIDLLDLLIEKYDNEHNTFKELDPVERLRYLMEENSMKAVDVASLLNVSEGLVSDILNYKKGFSKNSIRILSERFKLRQDAFNTPYKLKLSNGKPKNGVQRKRVKKRLRV